MFDGTLFEWQPISTAPKKGKIWLFGTAKTWDGYERSDAMVIGFWSDYSQNWAIWSMEQPREVSIEPERWFPLPHKPMES